MPEDRPFKRGMQYTLTAQDQKLALSMAERRVAAAAKHGHKCVSYSGYDHLTNHTVGANGEVAFARMAGIEPDTSEPEANRSSLEGRDKKDLIFRGNTINVKTTDSLSPYLYLLDWFVPPQFLADFYVLMHGFFPTYRYVGCMRGSELQTPSRYIKTRHGMRYRAEAGELSVEIPWKRINAQISGAA